MEKYVYLVSVKYPDMTERLSVFAEEERAKHRLSEKLEEIIEEGNAVAPPDELRKKFNEKDRRYFVVFVRNNSGIKKVIVGSVGKKVLN